MPKLEIMPMNSNKIVTDSLTKSLEDFQQAIAPLLEIGKIEQWDGKTLLKIEKKIREAALILGGGMYRYCTEKTLKVPRSTIKSY